MKLTPEFDRDLLKRYDKLLPRYTSYPTVLRFRDDPDPEGCRRALARNPKNMEPFSLYFHIPYCRSPCFFCGCGRIVSRDDGRIATYLDALYGELELVAERLPAKRRKASRIHLGGGSPSVLGADRLTGLWTAINRHFDLEKGGEYSIEIDPRTSSVELIERLAALGFDRMSFGIQDLNIEVQRAVNRIQSPEETFEQIAAARAYGVKSINVDLIYGLPKQTRAGFADTVERIIAARPDRVAVYSYAHLPHLFKAQTRIDERALPVLSSKLELLETAVEMFRGAGYEYIGMDHFALPGDELALARANDTLQRNFQGYSTGKRLDLLGFGITSIGRIGDFHYQNAKDEKEYIERVGNRELPIKKGYESGADDLIREYTIMSLMCDGFLGFEEFKEKSGGVDFCDYYPDAIAELETMQKDGLLVLSDRRLQVLPAGQLLLRNVCCVFDFYRQKETGPPSHSRSI